MAENVPLATSNGLSPDATPAIEVLGLSKRHRRGTLSNDQVSFAVPRGTIFGVPGPNGATPNSSG